jgi:hypothetical protein
MKKADWRRFRLHLFSSVWAEVDVCQGHIELNQLVLFFGRKQSCGAGMGIIYSIDRVCAQGAVTMDLRKESRGNRQIHDIRYAANT